MQVVDEHEDENYDVGAVAMQGWRTEMVGRAGTSDRNKVPNALIVLQAAKHNLMMVWPSHRRMRMWQSPGCGMTRMQGYLQCLMGTAAARCPASLRATW